MMSFLKRHLGNKALVAVSVSILLGAGLGFHVRGPRHAGASVNAAPPTCTPSEPPTSALDLTVGPLVAFSDNCLGVRATQPFTIAFHNLLVAGDGNGVSLNLSIYPSQDSAYTEVQSGEFVTHLSNAIFRGAEVKAPGTVVYQVPALPPGTYYVQDDAMVPVLYATLVVEE